MRQFLVTLPAWMAALACVTSISAATPEQIAAPSAWLGAPSCSARACHGDTGPQRSHPMVWGFEHTIWHSHDKHHRAYSVLMEPRSQQMAQRLGLKQPAHQAQQCLTCHAPAALDHAPAAGNSPCAPSYVTEGVGCEVCHGPAERWIAAHTSAEWGLLSPQEKEQSYGFKNTKDLAVRAELCVGCHVGGPGRDVNHDLIAAGHPRLSFEFSSYLRRMPPHWDEKAPNDRTLQPAFEARAWSIGQVSTIRAQLDLLASRAQAAADDRPGAVWPEFAEYSCYACHRQLGPQPMSGATASFGRPAWGTWGYPMLSLIPHPPGEVPGRVDAVATLMQTLQADEQQSARAASQAAAEFDNWIVTLSDASFDAEELRRQMVRLANEGPALSQGEWDIAAQFYLALAAWQQARLDVAGRQTPEDQSIARLLGQTRKNLLSPAEFQRSGDTFGQQMRKLGDTITR